MVNWHECYYDVHIVQRKLPPNALWCPNRRIWDKTNRVHLNDFSVAHSWRILWPARVHRNSVWCPEAQKKGLYSSNSYFTHISWSVASGKCTSRLSLNPCIFTIIRQWKEPAHKHVKGQSVSVQWLLPVVRHGIAHENHDFFQHNSVKIAHM